MEWLYEQYSEGIESYMNESIILTSTLIAIQLIMLIVVIAALIMANIKKLKLEMNKVKTIIGMVPISALSLNEDIKSKFLQAEFLK